MKPIHDIHKSSKETGSGIVTVLLSIAGLSIVSYLFFNHSVVNMKSNKSIELRETIHIFEPNIVDEIYQIAKAMTIDACLPPSLLKDRPIEWGNESAKLNLAQSSTISQLKTNPKFTAVALRCNKSRIVSPQEMKDSKYNHMFFCVEIRPSSTKSVDALVEIGMSFRKSENMSPTSCLNFIKDPGSFSEIIYGIHFTKSDPNLIGSFSKYGYSVVSGGGVQ